MITLINDFDEILILMQKKKMNAENSVKIDGNDRRCCHEGFASRADDQLQSRAVSREELGDAKIAVLTADLDGPPYSPLYLAHAASSE